MIKLSSVMGLIEKFLKGKKLVENGAISSVMFYFHSGGVISVDIYVANSINRSFLIHPETEIEDIRGILGNGD